MFNLKRLLYLTLLIPIFDFSILLIHELINSTNLIINYFIFTLHKIACFPMGLVGPEYPYYVMENELILTMINIILQITVVYFIIGKFKSK